METLIETSGVLTSPYYPRRYPSNEKCSWQILASKRERILLFIEDIYIAYCGSSCTCDYLEIQNGLSSDGISGRRRCTYHKDRGIVYHSTRNVLRVTFVSDNGTYPRYRGFKATYIKVKYNATNTGKLFVPSSTLSNIFRSLVKPYLSYGIAVWGQAAPTNFGKKNWFFKNVPFDWFISNPLGYPLCLC